MGINFSLEMDESSVQTHEESSIDSTAIESVFMADKCLRELESFILSSVKDEFDFPLQSDYITVLSQWDQLFERLRSLERCVDDNKKAESWGQWKRKYWLVMANANADLGLTQTCFVTSLLFLEENLLAEDNVWSEDWTGQVRSQWVYDCSSLVDPVMKVAFYDELFCNVDYLLNEFQCSSLQAYDKNMREVISKIDSAAEKLQKTTRDTGIADTTAGSAGIVSGILTGTGVILIPFTMGASLGLTIAGVSLGIGSAITSLSSSIVLTVGERSKMKEVKEETHKVAFVTMAILEMLKGYSDTAIALKKKLDKLGDSEALKYMCKAGSNIGTVGTVAMGIAKTAKVGRIIHIVRNIRPDLITKEVGEAIALTAIKGVGIPKWLAQVDDVAGIMASDVAVIASASAKVTRILGVIGSIVSVGFGIWDIVTGAKKIQNGSEIAKKFLELKEDLDTARKYVVYAYDLESETE